MSIFLTHFLVEGIRIHLLSRSILYLARHRAYPNIRRYGWESERECSQYGHLPAHDNLPPATLGVLPGLLPADVLSR